MHRKQCAYASACNRVGLDLLKGQRLRHPNQNIFISPLSLHSALTAASLGATGRSLGDMRRALRHDEIGDAAEVRAAYARMKARSYARTKDDALACDVANSIWASGRVVESFRRLVADAFDAEAHPLTTAEAINEWCRNRTHGAIDAVVSEIDADTPLVLVNAVYFCCPWSMPFDLNRTAPALFRMDRDTASEVDMMKIVIDDDDDDAEGIPYCESSGCQIVRLSYKGDTHHALVVLPSKESSADDVLADLDSATLEQWNANVRPRPGTLAMPRIDLDYAAELKPDLIEAGMESAFEGGFGSIVGRSEDAVRIESVIHKTALRLDEKGTEAAAVTAVRFEEESCCIRRGPKPFRMVVDRPFLLFL